MRTAIPVIIIVLAALGFLANAKFRYKNTDIGDGKFVQLDRLTDRTRICWPRENDDQTHICGRWK